MYLFSFWDVGAYAAVYVTLKLENCWQIFKNIHYIYVAWINFYMQIISSIDNICELFLALITFMLVNIINMLLELTFICKFCQTLIAFIFMNLLYVLSELTVVSEWSLTLMTSMCMLWVAFVMVLSYFLEQNWAL